jgi:hypothetical protein
LNSLESHLALLIAILAFAAPSYAADLLQIGSGQPGLKIATRAPDALVIYEDEPTTVGHGLMGGIEKRNIRVLIDRNYHFSKESMEISEQLYPLDSDTVFTSHGGSWAAPHHWNYMSRTYIGYRVHGSEVEVIPYVQATASRLYGLSVGEEFLGAFDNCVFFWRDFDPSHVYWRHSGDSSVFEASLPRNVIDIYGATRGIRKDVGFVVFAKAGGLIAYSPYDFEFVELSLSEGSRVHAP